jgi:hypothetical protein
MSVARLAALAGIVGPALVGFAIFGLTMLQWDFMLQLGWHPVNTPTFDWPSGLALGPYGGWMVAAFVFGGALIIFFGWQFCRLHRAQRLRYAFFAAGAGMMGLAFLTDPTLTTVTPTWHGRLHDLSFAVLGFGLFFAWLGVLISLGSEPGWRILIGMTFFALIGVPLGFVLRGAFFYPFLALALLWFVVAACAMWLHLDNAK